MSGSRVECVDVAKGVGIMFVILGHMIDSFDAPLLWLYPFIYLFHVPLFFFLSGLFFRQEERWIPFLKKKFLRLYVPYVLANVFFFFVEWFRARSMGNLYDGTLSWSDLWYAVLGMWPVTSMLSRPTWFILVLFRACIIYKLLIALLRGNRWLTLVACVVLAAVGILLKLDSAMVSQTLVALPFFSLGHSTGWGFFEKKELWRTGITGAFCVLSAAALAILSGFQKTNIAVGCYDHPVLMVVGALLGIMMTLWGCSLISKVSWIKKPLAYVGRHTLAILVWHVFVLLVFFKAVELLGGGREWPYMVDLFMYVVAFGLAVTVPCLLGIGWRYLKKRIRIAH